MAKQYSDAQKTLIMLGSDLLDTGFSAEERAIMQSLLASTGGDLTKMLSLAPDGISKKINCTMDQGLKLSSELNSLSQRGVEILFPGEFDAGLMKDVFKGEPLMLFVVGNANLLQQKTDEVSFSLSEFEQRGLSGIFVSDRAFGDLLRNQGLMDSLRSGRAVVASDNYRSLRKAEEKLLHDVCDFEPRLQASAQEQLALF